MSLGRSAPDSPAPPTYDLRYVVGWARLFRLHALTIVFIATYACSILLGIPFRESVILSLICVMGLAAGNTHNDVYDKDADAKTPHKAWRPIPSGVIHSHSAMNMSYFVYGMIVILGMTLSYGVFVAVVVYVGLLHLYNERARRNWGLYGHVVASLLTTSCVVLPMAYSLNASLYPLALGLFLLETGREIIVSIPDSDEGVKTLVGEIGPGKAAKLSMVYVVGWALVSPLAILTVPRLDGLYLIGSAVWAFGLVVAPLFALQKNKSYQWKIFQMLTKGPMVLFVVLLLLESIL